MKRLEGKRCGPGHSGLRVSTIGVLLERPCADRSVSLESIIPWWEHGFPDQMPTVPSPQSRARKNLLTLRARFPSILPKKRARREEGRTSQENRQGWSKARAQHGISQQHLPSAGGKAHLQMAPRCGQRPSATGEAVREAAGWVQRGVRIPDRKR